MLLTVTACMAATFKRPVNSQTVHQSRASSSAGAAQAALAQAPRSNASYLQYTYSRLEDSRIAAG